MLSNQLVTFLQLINQINEIRRKETKEYCYELFQVKLLNFSLASGRAYQISAEELKEHLGLKPAIRCARAQGLRLTAIKTDPLHA